MPLWLIAALVIGGGWYALSRVPPSTAVMAPSGRRWPPGTNGTDVAHAVATALQNETDPGRLRDFARQVGPYDASAFSELNAKAASLQVATEHVVSAVSPAAPPAAVLSAAPSLHISPVSQALGFR